MPPPRRFAPGFRLSVSDAVFILAGVAVSFFARKEVAIPTATAVGHFFLFCNVFRIARRPELVWAAIYVLLVTCTVAFGLPSWACSTAIALAVGILLIARETRKPDYHGVGWKVLNPNLPKWWTERHGSRSLPSKSAGRAP